MDSDNLIYLTTAANTIKVYSGYSSSTPVRTITHSALKGIAGITVGHDNTLSDFVYVSFPGKGLWKYDGTSWSQLTTENPQTMAASGSMLYADFGSMGLWKYDGTSWSQITGDNPSLIVTN